MFANCKDLESIPDLSKWELNSLICHDKLFDGCLNKKQFSKIFYMNKLFYKLNKP